MQKIKILVDSGSDMPREYCEMYGISVVPLNLQIEGRTVLDDDNLDTAKYCEYLKVAPEVPKSAQPSPQAFLDQYRANADCEHIIVITMSSKASGTHQSAVMARDLFEEENTSCRVHVVDSTSTSFAITMLALHAVRLVKEGKSASEIVANLAEHTMHTGTYYLIDDISFLIKGGRISSIKGGIASRMNIKPIVCAKNGVATPHSNALGFQKGIAKMVNLFETHAFPGSDIFISHSNCLDKAKALAEAIRKAAPNIGISIHQMRGTMSTHAGPNTVGLFFYQAQFN